MHTKLGDHSNCTCTSNSDILYSHESLVCASSISKLYCYIN